MPTLVNCPGCGHPLNVPDELHGRPVRCPACGVVFMLPGPGQTGPPSVRPGTPPENEPVRVGAISPPPEQEHPEHGPDPGHPETKQPDYEEAKRRIAPAAVGLIIMAIIGLLLGLYSTAQIVLHKQHPVPRLPMFSDEMNRILQDLAEGPLLLIKGVVMIVMNSVILLASEQMLRLRTWRFAVTGSILAMVNFLECCCFLGFPFGLYALTLLYDPAIRDAFD